MDPDPALLSWVNQAEHGLADVEGVQPVRRVRMRWLGRQIHADAHLDADRTTSLTDAHAIAHRAEAQLINAGRKLISGDRSRLPAHHHAPQPHNAHSRYI